MSSDSDRPAVSPPPSADDGRAVAQDARKRFELLEDCREMIVERLCKVIAEALARIGEELSELALRSVRRDEQRALLDAVSVVRNNRDEIQTRFRKAFVDCFERRLFDADQPRPVVDADPDRELSLVDDDVISDKLSVDRLVHRARGKLDPDEVLGMRARLAALLERDWFEEARQPAAPEAVFEALKRALDELAPAQEVQHALLDAIEPHVSANLNKVYTTVNERLKAHRVLPKIRPQVAIERNASARRNARDDAPVPGALPPDAHGMHPMHAAHGMPGMHAAGYGTANAGHGLPGGHAAPGYAGPGFGVADHAGHGFAAGGHDAAARFDLAMQQLEQGVPSARESVARFLTDPASFGVADLPMPLPQPPLMEAISHVQASAAADASFGSPQRFAELLERARDKGSPLDQLTVEIVSLVFDYIYADKRLCDLIKQQLLRLQVVAVKAALIDRSFFARRQHPMRRLIDRISELATDPDADVAAGAPLVRGIEQLVEWLLANFDQDLAVFDEALRRLEALAADEVARRAERLAQLTREAERKEALAAACAQAAALLADRVEDATPEFVRRFLLDWWSMAMGHASLADESAGLRSAEALQLAEALIWSVTPKLPDEISRLATLLPKLIGGLMRGLKLAAMPDGPREAFFNELLRSHTRAIEAAKQAQAQRVAAARSVSRIRMRTDGSIQFTPPREDDAARERRAPAPPVSASAGADRLLDELRRGDQIEVDERGETLRFKLAWVSPTRKLFILSRFPDEARSLEAAQLGALLAQRSARVVERHSSVDRAIDRFTSPGKAGATVTAAPARDGIGTPVEAPASA